MSVGQTFEELSQTLGSYYGRWRALTIAEGEAITAGEWRQVENLQVSKRQLQDIIRTARQELRDECARCGRNVQTVDDPFKSMLHELIALEGCNDQALASQRQRNRSRQEELQAAAHTLRQVREVYTTKREAVWQSYS